MHSVLWRRTASAGVALLGFHYRDSGHHLHEAIVGVLDSREHAAERFKVDDVAIAVLTALMLLELSRQSLKKRFVRHFCLERRDKRTYNNNELLDLLEALRNGEIHRHLVLEILDRSG